MAEAAPALCDRAARNWPGYQINVARRTPKAFLWPFILCVHLFGIVTNPDRSEIIVRHRMRRGRKVYIV